MHELSIATALVEQVCEAALAAKASCVVSVELVLGDLSGVEIEALELAFSMACQDTCAQGARLVVEREPLELLCSACRRLSIPDDIVMVCVHCNSTDVEVARGKALTLKSMEVL
ncbi:MAG: hydrogenase maturation nickel metallochaperone HypA [Myxococcota bacterium]|jgi:hydrogenase nickel incorporation protein HypA/HybF|nr:hydrogenase maturation nickel metallochaperone HypA [Myxococcota bacterium]